MHAVVTSGGVFRRGPEQFHHRLAEGREVVGLPRGNQRTVANHSPIFPRGAGITQVGLQGRPGCHSSPAHAVGVGDATRQHQCIELLRRQAGELAVHRQLVALVVVVHSLDLAAVRCDYGHLRLRVFQRLHRFGQFHLLHAIGCQHGHFPVCNVAHVLSLGTESRERRPRERVRPGGA